MKYLDNLIASKEVNLPQLDFIPKKQDYSSKKLMQSRFIVQPDVPLHKSIEQTQQFNYGSSETWDNYAEFVTRAVKPSDLLAAFDIQNL